MCKIRLCLPSRKENGVLTIDYIWIPSKSISFCFNLWGLKGFSPLYDKFVIFFLMVWFLFRRILFVFHKNGHLSCKAKVQPPRLNGAKTGVFSTRSPHRPNAIGLTLAKLEKVDGNTCRFYFYLFFLKKYYKINVVFSPGCYSDLSAVVVTPEQHQTLKKMLNKC